MGLGKILGSISPAFGIASGKGIFGNRDLLGSVSPLYGMLAGKGVFGGGGSGGLGQMGGMGMLGGLLGEQGGQPESPAVAIGNQAIGIPQPQPQAQAPTGMFGAKQSWGNALSAAMSGYAGQAPSPWLMMNRRGY